MCEPEFSNGSAFVSHTNPLCVWNVHICLIVYGFFFNRSDSLLNSTSQRHANARATASVNRLMDFVETPTFAIPAVYLYSVKKKNYKCIYIYYTFPMILLFFFFFNKTLFSLVAFFSYLLRFHVHLSLSILCAHVKNVTFLRLVTQSQSGLSLWLISLATSLWAAAAISIWWFDFIEIPNHKFRKWRPRWLTID